MQNWSAGPSDCAEAVNEEAPRADPAPAAQAPYLSGAQVSILPASVRPVPPRQDAQSERGFAQRNQVWGLNSPGDACSCLPLRPWDQGLEASE